MRVFYSCFYLIYHRIRSQREDAEKCIGFKDLNEVTIQVV